MEGIKLELLLEGNRTGHYLVEKDSGRCFAFRVFRSADFSGWWKNGSDGMLGSANKTIVEEIAERENY